MTRWQQFLFVSAAMMSVTSGVFAQTPPTQTDLAYTVLTPCRLLDTRLAGGPFAAGATRNFKVKGSNLSSQGGSSTGCGVATAATGAIINFVATDAAGPGHLKGWAYPAAAPFAAILNYGAVAGLEAIANGIAVPICDPAVSSCTFDLKIQVNVSSTHVVADVVGYFRKPNPVAALCTTRPCTVAVCSDNGSGLCAFGNVSDASGPCSAVSQTGTCFGTAGCKVCAGPPAPQSSSAACSNGGSVLCPSGNVAHSSANCRVTSEGGGCSGTSDCKACVSP